VPQVLHTVGSGGTAGNTIASVRDSDWTPSHLLEAVNAMARGHVLLNNK